MKILPRKEAIKDNQDVIFDNGAIKVIFIGCLAIAISLMVMSISSIIITRNTVVENLKQVVLQNLAGSISASIDGRIERAADASILLAGDPTVIKWLRSYEKDQAADTIVREKMLGLVRDLGYDTSFLASALSGGYWSCDNKEMKLLYKLSKEDPADSWFYYTLQLQKPFEININYDRELKDTFVWIDALVGDQQEPIAVTGVGMNLSKVVKELIAADSINRLNNEIFLVDDKEDIYLSKNQDNMQKNLSLFLPEQLKNDILSSDVGADSFESAEYTDGKNELYDIVYKKIKGTKWSIIVQIPRAESLKFLNTIIYNTLVACAFVIIVVIAMFYILSKRIADPYKRALLINQQLEIKIDERTKELNEKNAKLQDSIDYARVIQKTMLPSPEEIEKAFDEYFVIWEPRDTVGGDFYWIKKFNDGVLVVLGDCTGHGVPGSLMTMAANAILNQISDDERHNDPAWILNEMDRLLKLSLRREQGIGIIHDGLDAGVLFISNNSRIVFSGAQIPLWIGNGKEIKEIRGSRDSIGSDRGKKEKRFTNAEVGYFKGITLYMATDGLKDQPGGPDKYPFGKRRIMELLSSVSGKRLSEQKEGISSAYEAYKKDELRRDDVAVIGIKI